MVQIDDVIVSLDVFREKFLCDLHACKGECCIEGDAGAPVELEEVEKLLREPERLETMHRSALRTAMPQAADAIAEAAMELAERNK